MKPKETHPWYGAKGPLRRKSRKLTYDELLDREIERQMQIERLNDDLNDLEGDLRPARDPSVEYIEGGLRRLPVRYDSE